MNMLTIKNNRSRAFGFTLVEQIIYMGLIMIMLTVLSQLFSLIIDFQLETQAVSGVQQDGRYILSKLGYDIKRAESIVQPLSPGQSNSELILRIDGENSTYRVQGGILSLVESGVPNRLHSSETVVDSITFQNIGNIDGKHSIQLQFTLRSITKTLGGNEESMDFQSTIGVR